MPPHMSCIIGLDIPVALTIIHYLCASVRYTYEERNTTIFVACNTTWSALE